MIDLAALLLLAAVILFSGSRLSRYGERIAQLTGLGRAWLGLVLMASVTSLPELFVGLGSAGILGNADLAVGDVLGSCAFNLAILSLLDALYKGRTVLGRAAPGHVLAASLGILLMAIVGLGLFHGGTFSVMGWIGGFSALSMLAYFISIRLLHAQERMSASTERTTKGRIHVQEGPSLALTVRWYAAHALVVVIAALALPYFAERLSVSSGLGPTFIGTFLLAMSTSLPEVSVSISALRMGSLDMSVGNLLGSNLFNILILSLDDLVYSEGSLLVDASEFHLVSVLSTIIMTAIAIVGLTFRSASKRYLLAWDTLLILGMYIVNLVMLFHLSSA